MSDAAATLARTVLRTNLNLKAGESLVVESWDHSLDYTGAFVEEARRIGATPTVLYENETAWWNAVADRRAGTFRHLSKAEKAAVEAADVYLYFWGPADGARAMSTPDVDRFFAYNQEWYAAARRGGLRGCRMTLGLAGDPTAKRFGLSGAAWRERLMIAGAVSAKQMARKGQRLLRALARGRKLRVTHANGTDLTIPLRGAKLRLDSGFVDAAAKKRPMGMLTNNPTGQVFAAVNRAPSRGTIVGNRPVYNLGTYLKTDGVTFEFDGGKLTRRTIGSGRAEFEKSFKAAPPGGRERLSYFSIGLNPEARELAPCEDTEEGAILVGIGGNIGFGGSIRSPFNGHAMIGKALLEVDGEPIARNGRVL